jgi:glyoxylase-like metal-dependent hydrolase (beta-lactamase superfamily II)
MIADPSNPGYTGKVGPKHHTDARELRDLVITKIRVGEHGNNAYLLRCASTGEQVLIDAAANSARLLAAIGSGGLSAVVTTHRHADHWQALTEVVAATGARSLSHPDDAAAIPGVTDLLREGDQVSVGSCQLEVISLVGHTPGSIALLYQDPAGAAHLFTGDALFPGGVGNTWGNQDNFQRLIGDVEQKIFGRLPDDTWFYPGHGDDSTLGTERPALPEWRTRGF